MAKESNTKLIMGIVLIFLMISSLAGILIGGFADNSPSNDSDYNGFTFTQTPNGFQTEINDLSYTFLFHPADIDFVDIPFDFSEWSSLDRIYVSSDPDEVIAQAYSEFYRFRDVYGVTSTVTPACILDSDSCEINNYPVKTCDDASDSVGVIILEPSNSSSVTFDNNCLIVSGTIVDAVRYFDRVAYERLGVIQ